MANMANTQIQQLQNQNGPPAPGGNQPPQRQASEDSPQKTRENALKIAKSSLGLAIKKRKDNQAAAEDDGSNGVDKALESSALEYAEDGADTVIGVEEAVTGTMDTMESQADNKSGAEGEITPTATYTNVSTIIKYVRSLFGTLKTIYQHIRKHGMSFKLITLLPDVIKLFNDSFTTVNNFLSIEKRKKHSKAADYIDAANSTLDIISGCISLYKQIALRSAIKEMKEENGANNSNNSILDAVSSSSDDADSVNMGFTIFNLALDLGKCVSSWVAAGRQGSNDKHRLRSKVAAGAFSVMRSISGVVQTGVKYYRKVREQRSQNQAAQAAGPNEAVIAMKSLLDSLTQNENILTANASNELDPSIPETNIKPRIDLYKNVQKYLSIADITPIELNRCSGKAQQDNLIEKAFG